MINKKKWISAFIFLLLLFVVAEFTFIDFSFHNKMVSRYSVRENKLAESQSIIKHVTLNKDIGDNINLTTKEISHLEDVRQLHNYFVILIFVLLSIFMVLLAKFGVDIKRSLVKIYIPYLVFLLLVIIVAVFPENIFYIFHRIFFIQGNFVFGKESALIQLFPAKYFFRLFFEIFLRLTIITAIIISVGKLLRK